MDSSTICCPYLPGWEYIADGEPHVFGDRLYVFGSHDRFNGKRFCMNDYVVWSAPLSDLSHWECSGISYRKDQDPDNSNGKIELWAPDVALGPDGRYYLYYCLANNPKIGVAVSNKPEGPYEFLNHVHDNKGGILGVREGDILPFDPAVLVDRDGSVHLYEGQGPMFEKDIKNKAKTRQYAWHIELESDMVTMKTEPVPVIPSLINSKGTGFEGHEFFEASSIRRFGDKYYFIYSSVLAHELCWAVSDRPDSGFVYGGTLVSNGDIGLHDNSYVGFSVKPDHAIFNYAGNNHGSVEEINGKFYVFYHRQTNRHMYSRQACVAPIIMKADGSFVQAEMTSSGLSEALPGKGAYEARIACELYSKDGALFSVHPFFQNKKHPSFTQDEPDGNNARQYISNMRDGATAVFKYFDFDVNESIELIVRGKCEGTIEIFTNENDIPVTIVRISSSDKWTKYHAPFKPSSGRYPLLFSFKGKGSLDFYGFEMR